MLIYAGINSITYSMKIIITGGSGYKGVKLSNILLHQGHHVTNIDSFLYGYEPIFGLVPHKNYTVLKKDIRSLTKSDLSGAEVIYHLAGISSYPACEANPNAAQVINVGATRRLVKLLSPQQLIIYASTTTFYGYSKEVLSEISEVNPVSLYSVTKYKAEQTVMQHPNSVSLRFASLFGVSPRMRDDLMVNDFVHRAIVDRSLVLFDPHSIRTFLHVDDAIRAYLMPLDNQKKMKNQIYNVGADNLNFSKAQLAQKIGKYVKFETVNSVLGDRDIRDCTISYDKLRKLGFSPRVSIDKGIKELIKLYTFYHPNSLYRAI